MKRSKSGDPVSLALIDSLDERWKRFRKKLRSLRKHVTVDGVHDERTASRRLLSTLGVVEPLVGRGPVRGLEKNLKDILETLGPVRDLHVELDRAKELQNGARIPGFESHLRRRLSSLEKRAGRRAARIDDKRLRKAVQRIEKRLGRLTRGRFALLEPIDAMLSEAFEERRLLDPTDVKTLHRLRIALKKFRYGIEAVEPLLRGFDRRQLRRLRLLQDRLGDLHDLEVLSSSFRDFAEERGSGRLPDLLPVQKELLHRHNQALGEAIASMDRVLKYWKRWSEQGAARLRRKPA